MPALVLPPLKILAGGEWKDAQSGATFATENPATGETVAMVADGGAPDVDAAVRAARAALVGPWSKMSPSDRQRLLYRLGDMIAAHLDEVATLESVDGGKPIGESKNVEIPLVAEIFRYFAGWTTKISGQTLPAKPDRMAFTLREPVGVVAAIVPWNFPLLMASWKVAPSLACGNTVVLKPAEQTPLTALKLGELALEAGLPPGVLNIVPGGPEAGRALVRHPGVDKVTFTGSTEVGREVMREAAGTLKRITLELGGKNPNVIFADADLDAAVKGAVTGIFYNKGEVCSAGSRLFVERKVKDEIVGKLKERAGKLTQGDTLDPKTRLGPQVSREQMERVLGYVEKGKAEGARLVAGGARAEPLGPGKGWFVQPTIFDEVDNQMVIAREEIFGPVLAVIGFDDVDEVIQKANDTDFGLTAGVWTRDVKKALRMVRALKAGTVWVNTYNQFDPALPFGGYKWSGIGRELGEAAIDGYTELKSVMIDLA